MADIEEDTGAASLPNASSLHQYFALIGSLFYYTLILPIYKLLQLLVYLLSPLFYAVQFLLLPVTYLLGFVLNILGFPFRLEVRTKIETIYTYVGLAVLLGLIAAISLHAIVAMLSSVLGWDTPSSPPSYDTNQKPALRSAASHRASRRRKHQDSLEDMDSSDAANAVRTNTSPKSKRTTFFSPPVFKELDSELLELNST
ncbi:hypothetical protein EJ05DRAFT_539699 [Pseudovirgaria hyperparasitica]|uniref:Uncharacterized protein n=1 Tax=Pseudovirgaria hyperparasitica TaxID=470096 RepID=A0A6A6W470_9PEZI|nr:uncharacterized protein EJ05DRAFT_539699 [Pseudovirgaria hyperparasitica]KAF2755841.1 hypothetical protein EJ05DRAFT_539699 [Pseudovirgaria hyperparasitica]